MTTAVINGTVPNPNKAMYNIPSQTVEEVREAIIAMYTNPQGSNPFKNPMVKKVELSFFLSDCPNAFLIRLVNRKMGFVMENFENNFGAMMDKIMIKPTITEICCCNPKK